MTHRQESKQPIEDLKMTQMLGLSFRDFEITMTEMPKNLVDQVHGTCGEMRNFIGDMATIFLKRTKWKC